MKESCTVIFLSLWSLILDGGLGAPVTDEPCGWPRYVSAPSKVWRCIFLRCLRVSILGSRCATWCPHTGAQPHHHHLLQPERFTFTSALLFFCHHYNSQSCRGCFSCGKGNLSGNWSWGGGRQEIHGDLNWWQFSGECCSQLRQSITRKKITKSTLRPAVFNWIQSTRLSRTAFWRWSDGVWMRPLYDWKRKACQHLEPQFQGYWCWCWWVMIHILWCSVCNEKWPLSPSELSARGAKRDAR